MTAAPAAADVLTVSQLVLRASNALVAELGTVEVQGEISSYHHHTTSGHMYWTLKDGSSEVRCVMFKRDAERLTLTLADGAQVVVVSRPTIYRARGQFQLEVSAVRAEGHGALWLQYEALKRRLSAEGLFAEERKRPLPWWPRVIGIVTSSEGAALRDVCTVIRRRAPSTAVWLKPVPVQGRDAAPEIARAIRWFARRPEVEVLIVGRGGGSIEDLWAFNEEIVVRAICECPIPVISAVGHESDTTLADYAADLRAPTPSAAAERAVPETREIARSAVACFRRLSAALERQRLRRIEATLAPIKRYGFRRVRDRLREDRQRWAEGVDRVPAALAGRLEGRGLELREAVSALPAPPAGAIEAGRRGLQRSRGLPREVARRYERVRTKSDHLVERLHAASPLAILARGYAVVHGPDGGVLMDAAAVSPGDRLDVRLARGRADARVTHTHPEEER